MDIQQLRGRDATRATQLQSQLDDLREEVIYLKVKLRKDGTLGRSEYSSVRDRIEDVRSQSRGEANNTASRHRHDAQPLEPPVTALQPHPVLVDARTTSTARPTARAGELRFQREPRSTCG
jgi:hypothetical protein